MNESKPPAPEVDPVTSYAREVVAGHVITGRLVRLACQRHISDLETASARGLRFDLSEALAAIDFWQMCPHLKGRAAKKGETLKLEPWQKFIVGSVYGWKRADGTRRFRVAWVEVARKNGKSTLLYPAGCTRSRSTARPARRCTASPRSATKLASCSTSPSAP